MSSKDYECRALYKIQSSNSKITLPRVEAKPLDMNEMKVKFPYAMKRVTEWPNLSIPKFTLPIAWHSSLFFRVRRVVAHIEDKVQLLHSLGISSSLLHKQRAFVKSLHKSHVLDTQFPHSFSH